MGLFELGFLLFIAGFILVFVSALLLAGGGRARGGGLVLIGPFPIVFGSDTGVVKWLLAFGLLLAVLVFLIPLLWG